MIKLEDLECAFMHSLFYKSAMIKNGLDCIFGKYNNNVVKETNKYFIIEMLPKPFTKGLKPLKVKFIHTLSSHKGLNKIESIKIEE